MVQLVTPGTLLEPLTQQANFLLSVAVGPGGSLGLAWLDLSTSQFKVCVEVEGITSSTLLMVLIATGLVCLYLVSLNTAAPHM